MYDQFEYNGTLTDYPARTDWFWIVDSKHNDYADFNFDYTAPSWEGDYIHAFGDQYSKESNTFLVNKNHTQNQGRLYHKHTVDRVTHAPIYNAVNLLPFEPDGVRMFSNMFNFIKRMANKTTERYFWVTASVCDYNAFDFLWHPEIGEENFIHAWPSQNNKHGYTFLIPTEAFKKQQDSLQKLEWFEYIKMHEPLAHMPLPVNKFSLSEGVAEVIKKHTFTHHYEWFVQDTYNEDVPDFYPGRWDEINIEAFGHNSNVLLVPREAKSYILDQVYDYPHIVKHVQTIQQPKFDIIVLGYKEPDLEERFNNIKAKHPTAKLVSGIEGNVNAYKECARQSDTEYFWCVFAKSKLHDDFDFSYHPDCLERPHHHIFKCLNPMIDYAYGHMGIILYHKQMVLNATEWGPDFTCSFPVKLVDQISNIANYNQTSFLTYRTAFRECVKLASNCIEGSSVKQNTEILDKWLSSPDQWTQRGSQDAVAYVKDNGDLMKVFDWKFIEAKYNASNI